jgi:hypothetical protein
MKNREKLLTKIFEQGFRTPDWSHKFPPPVVSLEDFFEENNQPGSIAVNLDSHPGINFFYSSLKKIRDRNDVQDVLVNIYDLSDIVFNPEAGWPYSENIHILTSAPELEVQNWAEELLSDGAGEGWYYGAPESLPEPKPGYKWWTLSWD